MVPDEQCEWKSFFPAFVNIVNIVTAAYQTTFQAAMGDVRAQEYGLQLYKDNKDKYEIIAKDDW